MMPLPSTCRLPDRTRVSFQIDGLECLKTHAKISDGSYWQLNVLVIKKISNEIEQLILAIIFMAIVGFDWFGLQVARISIEISNSKDPRCWPEDPISTSFIRILHINQLAQGQEIFSEEITRAVFNANNLSTYGSRVERCQQSISRTTKCQLRHSKSWATWNKLADKTRDILPRLSRSSIGAAIVHDHNTAAQAQRSHL